MIIVLVEAESVQLLSKDQRLADHFELDEMSPSIVDWDAVDDERCGLFP